MKPSPTFRPDFFLSSIAPVHLSNTPLTAPIFVCTFNSLAKAVALGYFHTISITSLYNFRPCKI